MFDEEDLRKKKLEQQMLEIQSEIQEIQTKQKKKHLASIVEIMSASDISINEVRDALQRSGRTSSRAGIPAPIKYRHPDTGQSWSGRGRAPRWLTDEEAKGKTRGDFLV